MNVLNHFAEGSRAKGVPFPKGTGADVAGMFDVVESVLYDHVIVKATSEPVTLELFQSPLSLGKGLADTNMFLGGRLPCPNMFAIERMGFLVPRTSGKTPAPPRDSCWDFRIDQKIYARGPLALDSGWGKFHLREGWKGYVEGSEEFWSIGGGVMMWPEALEEMRKVGALMVLSLQQFAVTLHFESVPEDLDFWCLLVGKEARSVQ